MNSNIAVVVTVHAFAVQACPVPHVAQALPPLPHALSTVPG
jgi:hypothetical protein